MLQNKMDFLFLILFRVCANGKVVYIDDEPTFSYVVCEIIIHTYLESQGGTTKAEKYDGQFKQS